MLCQFSQRSESLYTKTLACGKNYRFFRTENPYKQKNYPVEQRAALVPKQYFSKVRSLENGLVKPPRRDTRALSPAGMFGGKAPLR
jgi:hypothetical protein